jgi:hypothetical protein
VVSAPSPLPTKEASSVPSHLPVKEVSPIPTPVAPLDLPPGLEPKDSLPVMEEEVTPMILEPQPYPDDAFVPKAADNVEDALS